MIYRVEYETEGREVYVVEADTPERAREIADREAENGNDPSLSEVTGTGFVGTEEVSDGPY